MKLDNLNDYELDNLTNQVLNEHLRRKKKRDILGLGTIWITAIIIQNWRDNKK